MAEKNSYVAILPDGTEHFFDGRQPGFYCGGSSDRETVAEEAVRKAKLTTPRSNPQAVLVEVLQLNIRGGKLVRELKSIHSITPPLERITEAECQDELDNILKQLPPEFAEFVCCQAWEDGQSSGEYEDVVDIANTLSDGLNKAIMKYTTRILKGAKQ